MKLKHFLIPIITLVIVSAALIFQKNYVINISDTYFVINNFSLAILIVLLFALRIPLYNRKIIPRFLKILDLLMLIIGFSFLLIETRIPVPNITDYINQPYVVDLKYTFLPCLMLITLFLSNLTFMINVILLTILKNKNTPASP